MHRTTKWAALAATIIAVPALAVPVAVTNGNFDAQTPSGEVNGPVDDWSTSGSGSRGVASYSNHGMTASPGSSNTTLAWSNGPDFYQVLSSTLEANTEYTLTVDVGRRNHDQRPVRLWLGTGSTFGEDYVGIAERDWVNPGQFEWEEWTTTFRTGSNPAGLGDQLRIELQNFSGAQPQYDNVTLEANSHALLTTPIFVKNHDLVAGSSDWTENGSGTFDIEDKAPTVHNTDNNYTLFRNSSTDSPFISQTLNAFAEEGVSYELLFEAQRNNMPGLFYEILAGGDVLASELLAPGDGDALGTVWEDLSLTTGPLLPGDPAIGEQLEIRLGIPSGGATGGGNQINLNNIRFLQTEPEPAAEQPPAVPEPMTALLGLAGLGVLAARRRRR